MVDIVDPFETQASAPPPPSGGIVDPFDTTSKESTPPAPHDFSWSQMATDIWPEIKKEAGTAYKGITDLSKRGEQGPVEGMLNTANAALSVPRLIASPITGAIKSIGGHGMANLEHTVGSLIAPETAAKDNPETMYETAKSDVDKAMVAARPAGAPIKVPNLWGTEGFGWKTPPVKAPIASTNPDVVAAAQRASEASGVPINVPRAFASDSIATQRAGQLAKNAPFVGNAIPRATGEMVDQMGNAVGSIASHYGEGSGPNVASRIGNIVSSAAEAEKLAAETAARTSNEAVLADWQRAQDEALHQVGHQENTALAQARAATGDMTPQDMGQALIGRLRTEEAAARAEKDRLYGVAGASDASVTAKSVRGVHGLVTDTLNEAGRTDPRTGQVDPQLLPASNRMMDELQNFSSTARPTRDPVTGRVVAGSPATAQEMEQTRKRLGNLSQAATNDADRAAARIIMNRFDDWQGHAYENALFSGSPESLEAFRNARAANRSWRQRFYNDRDDADGIINRVVTGEITPQEMSNWIVGSGEVGAKGTASRLLTRLGEATAGDPEAMNTVRAGIANRLFGTTEGATPRAPEKIASDIHQFFNGTGSDVANRLFTPEQRNAAINYANALRRGQEARADIAGVAKATKPTPMEVGPGPMQELATAILGKSGKVDEALFAAIDAYAKSGGRGDIKTLADIVRNIPAKDKGDLAGAIIRRLGHSDQAGVGGGFSPEKFATDWNKYTPQAKAILFGNSGPHRQALDDIALIAQRYKEVGRRFGNPSGTAQNVSTFTALAAMWSHPYVAVPAVIGGAVFAKMLSAPATAQQTAGFFRAALEMAKSPTPGNMARLTYAGTNFARAAERLGSNVSVPQFLQQLSGPGISRADQEPANFNERFTGHAKGGSVKKNNIKGYAEGGNAGDDYNTVLSPEEEQNYQSWKAQTAPDDSGVDYDLRGAYLADMQRSPDNGHMGDRFKKPNHPTFSDQSQYAIGDQRQRAGTWVGPEGPDQTFVPPTPYGRGGRTRGYADGGNPSAADLASQAEEQLQPRLNSLPATPTDNTNIDTALLPELPDTRPEWIKHMANAPHPVFWPERLLGSGLTLAHDVMTGKQPMPPPGLRREDYTDIPAPGVGDKAGEPGLFGTGINRFLAPQEATPYDPAYERAQDMAALAGSGGLGGAGEEAGTALGAGPFLRPALKYGDRIYKAPIKDPNQPLFFGAEHSDALPPHLREDFHQKALSGEDINDYKFGFMNHKGQFLEREPALDYGVKEGLVDPYNARYGTLTSTMLSDTSEPGAALSALEHQTPESLAKSWNVKGHEDEDWYHGTTHEFDKFDTKKGSPENYLGKYPHFSNTPEDASANYAGFGPDLTQRVELRAERIMQDKDQDFSWGTQEYKQAHEEAKTQAAKELAGPHEGAVIPAKLRMKNPLDLTDDSNWIDFSAKYDKNGEWVKDNPNTIKLMNSLKKQGEQYGFNGQKAFDELMENGEFYDQVKAKDLDKALRNNEEISSAEDPEKGDLVNGHVIANVYKDLGYDGVVMNAKEAFPNMPNVHDWTKHAVVFNPARVRSQFAKFDPKNANKSGLLLSDTSQNAPLAALEHQHPFYSAVEKTIQSAPQSKMHGEQWANWIKNQPGVKPDELQYTGVDNWLRTQKGPVTKQQVQDYIANNKVQVNDVVKGGNQDIANQKISDIDAKIRDISHWPYDSSKARDPANQLQLDALNNQWEQINKQLGTTKYENWQLPGGENYTEHLLTLPNKPKTTGWKIQDNPDVEGEYEVVDNNGRVRYGTTEKENAQNYINDQNKIDAKEGYKSSHWDEPNILAHVRTNDRVMQDQAPQYKLRNKVSGNTTKAFDSEAEALAHRETLPEKLRPNLEPVKVGDTKSVPTMHIEEIQSDWHQAGRKQGYQSDNKLTPEETAKSEYNRMYGEGSWDRAPEDTRTNWVQDAARPGGIRKGVPDAPFKTSWPELAMKRMIAKAVEEGKSRISWTPGEAQAARYDLSKHLETLKYDPDRKHLMGFDKSGKRVVDEIDTNPNDLPDIIGKDVADKLMQAPIKGKNEGGTYRVLEGADLKVGGEGMKGFYDQMLPKMVEKLGKQYGVKVKYHEPKKVEASSEAINKLAKTFYESYDRLGGQPLFEDLPITKQQEYIARAKEKSYLVDNPEPKVYYFDIPKAMAEKVKKEGFPLFSDTNTGVFGQADSDNKKNIPRKEQEKERARASGGRVIASNINHEPSEAQKKAGNYAKDHVHVHGLDITIENAKGSTRSGRGHNGKEWKSTLPSHYGYIKRTEGADKDHLDIYLGPHIRSDKVYVVNQINADTGKFDEHKIFLGFRNLKHALETYEKAFSDGKGLQRVGSVVPTDIKQLKEWLKKGKTKEPFVIRRINNEAKAA